MATTNTWSIAQLDRETADGFVFTVHYTVEASDETYKAGAYGSIGLERPETLTPYADLTEEVVVGWVKSQLTAEKVTETVKEQIKEAGLEGKVTEMTSEEISNIKEEGFNSKAAAKEFEQKKDLIKLEAELNPKLKKIYREELDVVRVSDYAKSLEENDFDFIANKSMQIANDVVGFQV